MALEYSYVLPPTGNAQNDQVREMFDDVKLFVDNIISGGGTGAPVDAQYVVLTANANLTVERVLTAGTAISLTDNGAGSTVVVANTGVTSIIAGTGISVSGATGAVTVTNTVSAGANTALSNLASVAINASLTPGTTNSIDLGSSAKTWRDVHVDREVILYETGTSNSILLKSPTSLASYTLTFPDDAGTPDYVLKTDGSGTTSWVAQPTVSGFATVALDNLSGVNINTTLKSDTDNTDDLGTAGKTWRLGYFKSGIHFMEQDGGVDTILVKAPNAVGTAYTFTLPDSAGTNTYVLQTNGSGTTSWVDPGTFPSGANDALSNLAAVAINTSLVSDADNTDNLGSSANEWATVYARTYIAGKSGVAGAVQIFPVTASKGSISIECADNTTDHILHITNAALNGASRTWTIPNISGNGTFAALEGSQTFSGTKTFSAAIPITATSNHLVLSTATNTLTINASTQATARVWSVPDISAAGTFAALEGTQTFTGLKTFSAIVALSAGSVSAPSWHLTDAGSGAYRTAANKIGWTLNGVKAAEFYTSGTADDVTYVPLLLTSGTGNSNVALEKQTTSVTTAAKTIFTSVFGDGQLIVVRGFTGTKLFTDLVLSVYSTTNPTVIGTSVSGGPDTRTYTQASAGVIKLQMGGGTYTVTAFSLSLQNS